MGLLLAVARYCNKVAAAASTADQASITLHYITLHYIMQRRRWWRAAAPARAAMAVVGPSLLFPPLSAFVSKNEAVAKQSQKGRGLAES